VSDVGHRHVVLPCGVVSNGVVVVHVVNDLDSIRIVSDGLPREVVSRIDAITHVEVPNVTPEVVGSVV